MKVYVQTNHVYVSEGVVELPAGKTWDDVSRCFYDKPGNVGIYFKNGELYACELSEPKLAPDMREIYVHPTDKTGQRPDREAGELFSESKP